MQKPSVYLMIAGGNGYSAVTRGKKSDGNFEIIETTESESGSPLQLGETPDWKSAGICDHRGTAGPTGFALLDVALRAAEANAKETSGKNLEFVTIGSGSSPGRVTSHS